MTGNSYILYNRKNYYVILVSVLLIIIGFVLMAGTSNNTGGSFNKEILNFRRITIAPVVILSGYALMFFGIMNTGYTKNFK